MEVRDFCEVMEKELEHWRDEFGKLSKAMEKLETGQKQKMYTSVNELHLMVQELDDRVSKLKKECPTDWDAIRQEIEGKIERVKTGYEELPGDLKAEAKGVSEW